MKEEILSYLREKKEASMDELAQRLGKEKAKDLGFETIDNIKYINIK